MAWERSFEKRVLKIREKELKYQKLNFTIEVEFSPLGPFFILILTAYLNLQDVVEYNLVWVKLSCPTFNLTGHLINRTASPLVVTLVAFFHFAVMRRQNLTPSIAFTSVRICDAPFHLFALFQPIVHPLRFV